MGLDELINLSDIDIHHLKFKPYHGKTHKELRNSQIQSPDNDSISKEDKLVKASRADMLLYGQIFSNYFCIARKSKVKFDDAISLAANNLTHLTPHPFKVYLSYSHPPVIDRISAIEAV